MKTRGHHQPNSVSPISLTHSFTHSHTHSHGILKLLIGPFCKAVRSRENHSWFICGKEILSQKYFVAARPYEGYTFSMFSTQPLETWLNYCKYWTLIIKRINNFNFSILVLMQHPYTVENSKFVLTYTPPIVLQDLKNFERLYKV